MFLRDRSGRALLKTFDVPGSGVLRIMISAKNLATEIGNRPKQVRSSFPGFEKKFCRLCFYLFSFSLFYNNFSKNLRGDGNGMAAKKCYDLSYKRLSLRAH